MSFVGKNIDKALDRTQMRTPAGRAVVAHMARHANKQFEARPSQALLARRIGINTRQVRTYLREAEQLGEIEVLERGANKATKYRVAILDDNVLDRQPTAAPNGQMDRQSTTEPKIRGTGSTASLDRQPTAYEVIEEMAPSLPASEKDGWDGDVAEKKEGAF